jgi:hypothetical protein
VKEEVSSKEMTMAKKASWRPRPPVVTAPPRVYCPPRHGLDSYYNEFLIPHAAASNYIASRRLLLWQVYIAIVFSVEKI